MIDKRLMKEIPQAKSFVIKQVIAQWVALLCNIGLIFIVAMLLEMSFLKTLKHEGVLYGFLALVVLIILRMYLTRLQAKYSYLASRDVKDVLRKRVYEKLLRLRHTYREYVSTSEVVQLSVEGIDQLETYFGRYLPQFFYSMIAPLTLFITLVWIDWKSSLVLLICVPLIPMSIIAVQKFAKKLLSKYWTSYANLGDSFLENLQGLTTLKIYQADAYKNIEMNKEAEHFRKVTMKVLTMQLNSVSVMDIVAYGGAALGSIVAVLNFLHGSLSLMGAVCITLLSAEFFLPMRLLGSYFHIAMNGIAASGKIFRLLDLEEHNEQEQDMPKGPYTIKAENVRFAYEEDRSILHGIDLEIHSGQFVAIAGESGSGKSTLAKLLMGIEQGYEGSLTVNGVERRTLRDENYWKEVTYVSHAPFLAKGTVRENLAMAKDEIHDEQMKEALKKVNLYDFLMHEQGLDTQLMEGGANLSGGQKQRLAIARAMLKDSEIYIFDEATSNIDIESEHTILSIIEEMAKQKTIILITHRLSSLTHCDTIYLLQDGEVKEKGTHKDLLQEKGAYAALFEKQAALEAYSGGEEDA